MFHKKLLSLMLILIVVLSYSLVATAQDDVLRVRILEDGDMIEDYLSQTDQGMLYAFNANEGDVVTISMVQTTDELDPYLALFGPAGELVATNDDADLENNDLSSLIDAVELPTSGTYFILASSFQFITTIVELDEAFENDLTFELSISGITPLKDEESTSTFFADDLIPGETLEFETTAEQPAWYFLFAGNEGDVVDLSASSEDFDTILYVFGPGGPRVAVNDDIDRENGDYNSAIEGLELPADGIYLVMLSNPYVFQFQEEAELEDSDLYGIFSIVLNSSSSGTSK